MARRRRAPWGTIWGNQANVDNESLLGWGRYVGRPAPYGYRDPMEEDEGGGMGMGRGGRGGGMSYLPIRAMSMGGGDGGDELEMGIGSMSEEDFGLKRGGKAKKGRVHLVGEEGQELLVPRTDGGYQVIPNEATEPLLELLGEGERGNGNPMRRRCGGGVVRRMMGGPMGVTLGEYVSQGRRAYNNADPGLRRLAGPPVPTWGKGGVIEENCGGGVVRRACGGKVKRHQGGGTIGGDVEEWMRQRYGNPNQPLFNTEGLPAPSTTPVHEAYVMARRGVPPVVDFGPISEPAGRVIDQQNYKASVADEMRRTGLASNAAANEARRNAIIETVSPPWQGGELGVPERVQPPPTGLVPAKEGEPMRFNTALPRELARRVGEILPSRIAGAYSRPLMVDTMSAAKEGMDALNREQYGSRDVGVPNRGRETPVSTVSSATPTSGSPFQTEPLDRNMFPTVSQPTTQTATPARPISVIRGTEQTWANPADTQTEYGTEREAMRGRGTPVQSLTAEMPGNLLHSDKQRANWMLAMARIRGQQASAAERAGWENKLLMQDIANQAKLDQIQAAQEGRNMPPIHTTEGEITQEWNPQLRRYVPTEDFKRRKTIEEHRPAIGKLNTRESLLNYFSSLPDNYTRSVVRGLLSEDQLAMLFSK